MRRRMTALLAALVLATVGATALIQYVQSARDKVLAQEAVVPVLVTTVAVPKGSAVTGTAATIEKVPARLVAPGALASPAALAGLVAKQDIFPGQQITASMLQSPVQATSTGPPPGKLLVTISLGAEQTVGGRLQPGDNVALFASYQPQAGTPGGSGGSADVTHLVLHNVQIAALQGTTVPRTPQAPPADTAPAAATPAAASAAATPATQQPSGTLLVTLVLSPKDAETVIYAAQHANVWLALEPAGAPAEPIPPAGVGNLS